MGYKKSAVVELINTFTDSGIGAEIGVAAGTTSLNIIEHCNIHQLYLVDPWQHGYSGGDVPDRNDVPQKRMERRYQRICKLLEKTPHKATIVRKTSVEAAKIVPNDLDFIYIDADHKYEAVYQDLESWVPKMRPGGLVIGDDWSQFWPNVVRAVIDFCNNHDYFIPPFEDYSEFPFLHRHRGAPHNKPVVNKTRFTWWALTNGYNGPCAHKET